MQKIQDQGAEDRKLKRRQLVLGVFLIIIMVGSTLGFAFSIIANSSSQNSSSDKDIYYDGSQWIISRDGIVFALVSGPSEVENVSVSFTKHRSDYVGSTVYIDAQSNVILNELGGVIGRYAANVQEACYGSCQRDIPEKSCSEPMIVWNESASPRVYQEQECIFIDGDIRSVDAFLYKFLGS